MRVARTELADFDQAALFVEWPLVGAYIEKSTCQRIRGLWVAPREAKARIGCILNSGSPRLPRVPKDCRRGWGLRPLRGAGNGATCPVVDGSWAVPRKAYIRNV